MKVLFHCYEFPPQAGGVGGYLYQMASSLKQMGHHTVVVTSRAEGFPEMEETSCGIVYRLYDRDEIRRPRVRDAVLSIAAEHDVDLIEGADHHGEMKQLIMSRKRPPVLIKIHGSNPIQILQDSQVLYGWQRLTVKIAHLRNWDQTAAERFSIENADMAFIPSSRMKEELLKEGIRLPSKNMVVPNPVVPFNGALNPESAHPTILLVGRIDIGKGIQYLPDMIRNIVARVPGVILEIAGDDSYAWGLGSIKEWLLRRLGSLAEHVKFLGKLDKDELDRAYGRAWVMVILSRWDNFPTVLLEAMARSKPVVSSPHGGMPEMLEGTLCRVALPESPEFVNSVVELLQDSSKRKKAGESLLKRSLSLYSPETVVKRYLDTLRSWGIGTGKLPGWESPSSGSSLNLSGQAKTPLISVITVVRNGANHFEKTISSLEGQDFRDFEHVVIDGGSTDGTVDLIKRHEKNIAYWVSEPDNGIADAFNKGVLASKGSVLLFLGSDDCLKDDSVLGRIAKSMTSLKKPYFFYGDIDYVYLKRMKRICKNYSFKKFCRYSCLPHQAMFLDRFFFDKYGLFDLEYKMAMDYEHTARFIKEYQPEHVGIVVSEMMRYGVSSRPLEAHREMDVVRLKHGLANRFDVALSRVVLHGKIALAGLFHLDW